jgi:hypothetical protein
MRPGHGRQIRPGRAVPAPSDGPMQDAPRLPRRKLRFFLRDFRVAEAYALLPDGLSLSSYLANRRGYLHLLDVQWQPSSERIEFAVLRTAQVMYASAAGGGVPLVNTLPAAVPHGVEVLLEGGLFLRGGLMLSPRQRLGDFLEAAGPFVPLLGVALLRSGRPPRDHNVTWGDIVLNQDTIQAVWECDDWAPASGDRESSRAHAAVTHDEPLPNG